MPAISSVRRAEEYLSRPHDAFPASSGGGAGFRVHQRLSRHGQRHRHGRLHKVLTPRQAMLWPALWNLSAPLRDGGRLDHRQGAGGRHASPPDTVLGALLGGHRLELLTWWLGLPSSSSHALIGGLCGAALGKSGGDWGCSNGPPGLWPKGCCPCSCRRFSASPAARSSCCC